jgi:dTDP-L-rhamnose 4-epimerase
MAPSKVLVTGGAGFIGSHLVDRLVADGRDVRVLDSLEPQVHDGSAGHRNDGAEYLEGSVLDGEAVDRALKGVGSVVHLAAQVGVGQSMYEMARYVEENCLGTASLLERIAEHGGIEGLVVASSMSIYGEGQFACESCGDDDVQVTRSLADLEARNWDPRCVRCGGEVRQVPTTERKRLEPDSIYATSKRDQEELVLVFGRSHGIRSVALRLFNVYGPRQSLSNPYTGVAAIFSSRLLSGNRPTVYEDGLQSRDFVHVSDIARAFQLALDSDDVGDVALNVGTGRSTTVLDVARVLAAELGVDIEPEVVNKFRHGDVRHCWADISAIRDALGYEPSVEFGDGMRELVGWIKQDSPDFDDRTEAAAGELRKHGLVL